MAETEHSRHDAHVLVSIYTVPVSHCVAVSSTDVRKYCSKLYYLINFSKGFLL